MNRFVPLTMMIVCILYGDRISVAQQAPDTESIQKLKKFVDRQNGFSVYYGNNWAIREPNESVTKLLVVSPIGNRCWATVIENPGSTGDNAKQIVQSLLISGKTFEDELKRRFGEAYVASVRPVLLSGNHDSAMFSYSYRYQTLAVDANIAVLESHIPTKGFTYKIGCSTVSDGELSIDFQSGAASFFRSFMIIPRQG